MSNCHWFAKGIDQIKRSEMNISDHKAWSLNSLYVFLNQMLMKARREPLAPNDVEDMLKVVHECRCRDPDNKFYP